MKKLSEEEASNIYGGIAFAAFITLITEVALSITAIVKIATSDTGSIKSKKLNAEYKWDNNPTDTKTKSPAFFGY